MGYHVEIEATPAEYLVRLARGDRASAKRINTTIRGLAEDPRPHGSIKLTGQDGYRVRVGNYRVVYAINDTVRVVTIVKIGHRRDVYER